MKIFSQKIKQSLEHDCNYKFRKDQCLKLNNIDINKIARMLEFMMDEK